MKYSLSGIKSQMLCEIIASLSSYENIFRSMGRSKVILDEEKETSTFTFLADGNIAAASSKALKV
jgi:WD40 repeat protein